MVSSFISRIVILVFGTLYPAYASYKAVRAKNVKEYVKWMMYWIVFALFTCAETFTDLFLSFWFPFYYEIKIITVIYLLSPATKGSSILYRKFVHPALIKKEQEIDEYIAKAKEQGYHTVLNLGSKGVSYATSLIMQTAIKSGGGLVSQLRRSYSLSDLSEEQNLRRIKEKPADDTDSSYEEDPRPIRRKLVQSPHKSADQAGLYFSEVDFCQRPEDGMTYRQIPSVDQMSSGYSSGDPLYSNIHRPKGEHLVRTASLGPSTRIRTRAVTKNGLPKRAGLSEGGSTWSALESYESQNETDNYSRIPFSHRSSLPLSLPSFQHFFMPEYQYMYGNMPQNQIFTFINHSQYSQFLNNQTNEEKLEEDFLPAENEVLISEEDSSIKPNISVVSDDKGDTAESQDNKDVTIEKSAEESQPECGNSNPETVSHEGSKERSGKYNKKPAPTPPNLTVEDEETEFHTPNASPKSSRKQSPDLQSIKNTTEAAKNGENLSEPSKKSKSKSKKGDFNIQKKLHIPKMSFSFWHQKSGKDTSVSETSSVASVDVSSKSDNKEELEYFIPLKDVDDENVKNNSKID